MDLRKGVIDKFKWPRIYLFIHSEILFHLSRVGKVPNGFYNPSSIRSLPVDGQFCSNRINLIRQKEVFEG